MSTHYNRQLLPETRIEHYKIEEVLGIGGFGITYKALDTRLQRAVAIKEFLPAELAIRDSSSSLVKARSDRSEDFQFTLERFLLEAQILAKFDHPNIVKVTHFVEANGTAYLIMDYVYGQSLSDHLKSTKRPVEEGLLLDWAIPLLRGLAEVHEAGFLHRDIKPGNIYLRDQGEPLLIDFGAARQAIGEQTHTITGIISAGYAPTEQYSTDSKRQGPWTDLYALGATLYRCVSGVVPTESPTRQSALIEGEADPLVPAVTAASSSYSTRLLETIDQMLVLPIRKRPQSALEILEKLSAKNPAKNQPRRQSMLHITGDPTEGSEGSEDVTEFSEPETIEGIGPQKSLESGATAVDPEPIPSFVRYRAPAVAASFILVTILVVLFFDPFSEFRSSPKEAENGSVAEDRRTETNVPSFTTNSLPEPGKQKDVQVEEPRPENVNLSVSPQSRPTAPSAPSAIAPEITSEDIEPKNKPVETSATTQPEKELILLGTVLIESSPVGAEITLDGTNIGRKTPFTLENLELGEHTVELSLDRYRSATKLINVTSDDALRLSLDLEPIPYGRLTISSSTPEIEITLPDIKPPYTPGMSLPTGAYRIIATAPQHIQYNGFVEVTTLDEPVFIQLEPLEAVDSNKGLATPTETFEIDPDSVLVSAGRFQMGCSERTSCPNKEKPVRTVSVPKPFAMMKHEVTFSEYDEYARETGSPLPPDGGWGRGKRPVINVSWDDASKYASWLSRKTGRSYRLPTEAEWEYAARAGSELSYGWGKDIGNNNANCDGCGSEWDDELTAPVGSFAPNAWGLHDMSGNVKEWVEDCWHGTYKGAPENTSAWLEDGNCGKRVLRGGSFKDSPDQLRSSNRNWNSSGYRYKTFGFRLVYSLPEQNGL